MEMRIKKVYYCEFCKTKMFQKSAMERHEQYCYRNPENSDADICKSNGFSCVHLTTKQQEVQTGNPYDSDSYTYTVAVPYFCKKYNQSMHNLRSEVLQRPFIKRHGTVLMPRECKDYEDNLPF